MAVFPNIAVDMTSSYSRQPRNLQADFGDGYSQVTGDGINAWEETWNMAFTNRPKADVFTIQDFLNAHNGQVPFDWQAPDDNASKKWRWIGKYTISDAEANNRSITFQIKRYFGS